MRRFPPIVVLNFISEEEARHCHIDVQETHSFLSDVRVVVVYEMKAN